MHAECSNLQENVYFMGSISSRYQSGALEVMEHLVLCYFFTRRYHVSLTKTLNCVSPCAFCLRFNHVWSNNQSTLISDSGLVLATSNQIDSFGEMQAGQSLSAFDLHVLVSIFGAY